MDRNIEFTAGARSLDLIDTLSDRSNLSVELIRTPEDLSQWLTDGGIVANLNLTEEDLWVAKDLRETAFQVLSAALKGDCPAASSLGKLNTWASHKDFRPEYVSGGLRWHSDRPFQSALSTLAADALLLLDPETIKRLRRCRDCQMLFVDNSRPGNRIWCSSSSGCGNRAKVRRHRARKSAQGG